MNTATRPSTDRIRVAVLAFDGISPFLLSIPGAVFAEAAPAPYPFEVVVVSADPEPLTTSGGWQISGLAPLTALARADVVVVPGWRDPHHPAPAHVLDAVRSAARNGAYLVGLCLGAFVLADAGLLDGTRATTHWQFAELMAARFPTVAVAADVLYIESGTIMTSAGTAAGLDACLQWVRRRLGSESANQIARRLVIPPHRAGGQAQFIEHPLPRTGADDRLSSLIESVRQRLDQAWDVDDLAVAANMSRRSFTRRFKALTGTTVLNWLLTERLHLAQRLLESTDQAIERVAESAGFGSAEALRHHFRHTFGLSPAQWRRGFRGRQPATP